MDDPVASIDFWADKYNVSPIELQYVIKHESQFDPTAVGKAGEIGACQILLSAHSNPKSPDYITRAEARDPDSCVAWTAKMWSEGHAHWWTTHWIFE